MNLVKLTRQDGTTSYGGPWAVGTRHEIAEEDRVPLLCSPGVLHAYRSLELGLLVNPIMGDIQDPIAWSAEGEVVTADHAKVGCYSLKITGELEIPAWYKDTELRRGVQIMFAVLCAESVLPIFERAYPDDNRPREAIAAASEYLRTKEASADEASRDAYDAACEAEAYASEVVAHAAKAASYAALAATRTAENKNTGETALDAAIAAAYAGRATRGTVNLDTLARQAVARFEAT